MLGWYCKPVLDLSMEDVQDFAILEMTGRISDRKPSRVAVNEVFTNSLQSVLTV